jgi:ATP-dependent helicase YprA (DUF1998 family)
MHLSSGILFLSQELAKLDNVELIQKDGSPCGLKYFLLWNPPLHMRKEGGSKGSSVTRRSRYLHPFSILCYSYFLFIASLQFKLHV